MPPHDPAPANDPNDDLGTSPRSKKQYATVVAERDIRAPRNVAFEALCGFISELTGSPLIDGADVTHEVGSRFEFSLNGLDLVEEVISFEPPWRRVSQLYGAPVNLCQTTVAFTDKGDSCLMAWSVVVDPLPGNASRDLLRASEVTLDKAADEVKARAESS